MKQLFFLLLFASAFTLAQAQSTSLESINQALNAGNADALTRYFADNVEISIQDKEQTYTKSKATDVMRNFFSTNKPKRFSPMHKGNSRENSDQYCIGNLDSSSGSFRVYLYLKTSGSSVSIQEMRFDKE
ncbi:MAG TPA: DUF4783 domain-containing protein [Saprospiraceae bacterium]|nr:DUF4783 domain-containing protein [Saprospiraceae bacterium]HND88266.1 DUF4783 domain-containing protein [Saprospiraceae bacterium]